MRVQSFRERSSNPTSGKDLSELGVLPYFNAPRLDRKKSKGKILGIKVLGSYLGVVSCEFKFS